jgi:hypothetical protein
MKKVANTTPQLELRELKGAKISVIISDKVARMINILHRHIGSTEWSGIISYSINTKDISEIVSKGASIKISNLYLMDIGTSANTEIEIDNMEEYPEELTNELFEGNLPGLIHTHHGMDTFFSGTDENELRNNTPNNLIYLSVIVNYLNGGKPIARLCFNSEEESTRVVKIRKGGKYQKLVTLKNSKNIINYVTCDVLYENEEEIKKQIEDILEEKRTPKLLFGYYSWNNPTTPTNSRVKGTTTKSTTLASSDDFVQKMFNFFNTLLPKSYRKKDVKVTRTNAYTCFYNNFGHFYAPYSTVRKGALKGETLKEALSIITPEEYLDIKEFLGDHSYGIYNNLNEFLKELESQPELADEFIDFYGQFGEENEIEVPTLELSLAEELEVVEHFLECFAKDPVKAAKVIDYDKQIIKPLKRNQIKLKRTEEDLMRGMIQFEDLYDDAPFEVYKEVILKHLPQVKEFMDNLTKLEIWTEN